MINFSNKIRALSLCIFVTGVAVFTAVYIPISVIVVGLLFGIIAGNTIKIESEISEGVAFFEKHLLYWAIALMGVKVDYAVLNTLGYPVFFLVIVSLVLTVFMAVIIGVMIRCEKNVAILTGIGQGVCGSAAVVASQRIVGVSSSQSGVVIAVVNLLGIIGTFMVPILGAGLGLEGGSLGIFIGNTLQSMGHVVAGGYMFGDVTGEVATLVKLGRIVMLTPLIIILLLVYRNKVSTSGLNVVRYIPIPLFIIGFVLFSVLSTMHFLPENILFWLGKISDYALLVSMVAIGLRVSFRYAFNDFKKILLLASLIFLLQIFFNFISVIFLFYS